MQLAKDYATVAHDGVLDDAGNPYIEHPIAVADIVWGLTKDKNLTAAAYLHDVIEDTETTHTDLELIFGKDVADLVNEVTHEGKKDSKGYYFPRLKTQRGILLKFADRLHNLSRMEAWDEKRKEQYMRKSKFWKSEI